MQNGLIVYGAEKEGVPTELYTIKPDGTGVTQLTHLRSGEAVNPDWSQDGGATHLRGGGDTSAAAFVSPADGSDYAPTVDAVHLGLDERDGRVSRRLSAAACSSLLAVGSVCL